MLSLPEASMLVQNHQKGLGCAFSSRSSIRRGSQLTCKPTKVACETRQHSDLSSSKYSSIHDEQESNTSAISDDLPLLNTEVLSSTFNGQQQQTLQTQVQQEQRGCQQLQNQVTARASRNEQARQLTAQIIATTDVTQLLLVLAEHVPQMDHIHVSAAVKHACRRLQLQLTLPDTLLQQRNFKASQQQGQQQHVDMQQWLQQEPHIQQVQLRVAQLKQQQLQDLQARQVQQPWRRPDQVAADTASNNEQQQDQLRWVVQQQLQPQELLQQQLAAAQHEHEHPLPPHQQQHSWSVSLNGSEDCAEATGQQQQQQQQQVQGPALPSDSWLLLLLLSQLVTQHSSSMESQQLCTCLNSLTYLLLSHPALPLLGHPVYRTAVLQLLQGAGQQMQQFDHRALSVLIHSAAVIARSPLGFAPRQGYMRKWYWRSRTVMGQASALDFAMAAWALGRLGAYPPTQWTADFFTHSKFVIPALQPQELVLLLLGVADMERMPRRSTSAAAARAGWVPAAAKQLQAHVHTITPHQLSGALLAFAKLQYQPSKEWLAAVARAWELQQSQFTTKGHSMVLWGVGAMSQAEAGSREARVAWARQIQAALQQAVSRAATAVAAVALLKLRQAKEQQQQQLVQQDLQEQCELAPQQVQEQQQEQTSAQHQEQGLPKQNAKGQFTVQQRSLQQQQQEEEHEQGATPEQQQKKDSNDQMSELCDVQLLQDLQHQLQLQQPLAVMQEQPQLLSSASLLHPTDCAMVIYALARLGPSCMDPDFAVFWLRQCKSQLSNMNSQELATCLWALGRLGLRPPTDWLQQHLACSAQLASCMTHQQLAMLLWGLAKLQYLPDVFVTAELLMSAAEQLPSFSSHSLALLVYSLGMLHLKPNKELMHLLLEQAKNKFRRFDAQDLCGLLLGLYRLRYNPGQQWLGLYAQTLATKVHLMPAKKHAVIVQVLRAMGYTCKGKPFAWVMDEAAVAAMCNRDGSSSSSNKKKNGSRKRSPSSAGAAPVDAHVHDRAGE